MYKRSFTIEECHLSLPVKGSKTYRLVHQVSMSKQKKITNRFIREVVVRMRKMDGSDTTREITMVTKELLLKMGGNASVNNRLASKLATVYDRVHLTLFHDGRILSINNLEEIQNQWKRISAEIFQDYNGREIHMLLSKTAIKLNSEKAVIKEIKQYNFFGLLLKEMYGTFNDNTPVSKLLLLPTSPSPTEIREHIILKEKTLGHVGLQCLLDKKELDDILYSGIFRFNIETSWLLNAKVQVSEKERNSIFELIEIED